MYNSVYICMNDIVCIVHVENDDLLLQWKSLPVFVVGKATAKAGK